MPSDFTRSAGMATRSGFNPDAITAIDIAHGLGTIRDEFARELFCHLWWPDGAARTRADLERQLHSLVIYEFAQRCREAEIAMLELHMVETNASQWRTDDKQATRKAKESAERTRKACWPKRLGEYPPMVVAVLEEMASPNHCVMCGGRGVLWDGELARDCGGCDGTGTIAVSDRQRAQALKKALKSYQQAWAAPYAWLHRQCWIREGDAAKALRKFLTAAGHAAAA